MTLFDKIYWKFYPGVNNKVVYLQRQICGFHLTDETVKSVYGLTVHVIDYDNDTDLQQWCDIMNNSYDDCFYDIPKARKFLSNHPLFTNNKTIVFYKGVRPCVSVSWGGYKRNAKIGGDFRIGVINDFKGCGYGRMSVEYAYSRLAEEGYKYGETVITIKRVPSLMLHFSLGFIPQYNMRFVTHKDNLKYINFIQRIRLTYLLHKYYNIYKQGLNKEYL